jgi:hypothetical protein
MRTYLELLIIVRDHLKTYPLDHIMSDGICLVLMDMKISFDEKHKVINYIKKYAPKRYYNLHDNGYYWPKGETKPRIEWLNTQIERLSKK